MMRATLVALAIAAAACSSTPEAGPEDDLYTLDLARYSPGQEPPALKIANETVVFPLALGPRAQALTAAAPGDLVALYTRVGCNVDPNAWIGAGGAAPARLPDAAPVHLREITVDQVAGGANVSQALADGTCVSVRTNDGTWHAFVRPIEVTMAGPSVHLQFAVDARATAAAIFLPTYTYVSQISYRIARE